MSLKTWKKEFYPVDGWDVSEKNALDHSIKKWEGLRKPNLEKHHIFKKKPTYIADRRGNSLPIDAGSCALCYHYFFGGGGCEGCPLFEALGKECDRGSDAPFAIYAKTARPLPMIKALKKAKKEASQ